MAGKNRGRSDLYRTEREKGMTYREIAEKHGVSYQCVAHACGKYNPERFQYHKEEAVVFPNLRKWMNDNKISNAELLRRLGYKTYGNAYFSWLRYILNGRNEMKKSTIDKLLAITGMTYEELLGGSVNAEN